MGILENNDISEDDFAVLLEDRAFVDYFNIYLSLPIFGQHVIYNFIERAFSYEPPIRKKKNLVDRRAVVHWLYTKRYPSFSKSNLCTEYMLSSRLRDVNVNLSGKNVEVDDQATLTRNILGNAVGMQLFRESLIGTPGEKCYRCWLDLERHRRMPPGEQRQRLMLYIRNIYLADGALHELKTAGRHAAFEGKLNFELIPETEIQRQLIEDFGSGNVIYRKNSDDAFQQLQRLILAALRMYWVPRYLLNLLNTVPKQYLAVLKRGTPYDQRALQEQRQMTCNLMFPKIYDANSSPTKLIESNIDGEMKAIRIKPVSARSDKPRTQYTGSSLSCRVTLTSSLESCSIPDGEDIKISDFLSIAGGGRLEYVEPKESKSSISSQEFDSLDFGSAEPRTNSSETNVLRTTTPSFTLIRPTLSIPPSLVTYISGKNRIKKDQKTNSKVMFALAADNLAGNPLQSYLNRSGKTRDEKLLKLWTDVRQYLDADDSHRDDFGQSIKQHLARVIFNQYLVSGNDDLLPESVKMSIYTSLSRQDDATLLCFVQDFVTGSLKDTWKIFMLVERRAFRKKVVGNRHFDRNVLEYPPNMEKDPDDPLLFINTSQGISPEMLSKDYRPKSGSISEERPWSRLSDNLPVALTDEQIMKAFEFTVILAEYGRPGMFTYNKPTVADIIDVLYSDYGSLHINKVHPKRHPFLYNLMNKPKIDIENLKVSRQVFVDRPTITEAETPRNNRLVLRRDGLLIERPSRPRTFMEVLNSALHFDFFRRFMASYKTPYPLAFWKNIEELREMPPGRLRHNMISNIIRKYFSKSAKQGAWLDCGDDIIRQIPSMEKVPLGVLVCAQASVFRAMERKWYPKYLETFPPDADYEPEFQVPTLKEEPKPRVRRVKKKRTLYLWNSFLTTMCAFLKSTKDQREVQLLELYMRKEIRREFKKQSSKQHDYPPKTDKNVTTGSNIHFQTRIVLKNRLVYVDKLPMDLQFWCEVARYVEMVDYIHGHKSVSRNNQDFLYEKAKAIVNYYVSSDIPPKNQLNISTDLATHISSSLDKDGPTRGLFHDALLVIFPLIYHYWRQCQKEWMKNHTAAELMEMIEKEEKSRERPNTPHKLEEVPDYLRIRASQIKVATQFVSGYIIDEDQWIINFSLVDGMRILLPQPKKVPKHGRTGSMATRRTSVMEKGSHKILTESDSKMSESSHKKEKSKDKEKSKLKTKSKKKMDALTEEADSRFSSQNIKPTKSRSSHTPPEGKEKLVDELVERSSKSPSRLRKMNDLVSAAIQDDIDQDIFGTE